MTQYTVIDTETSGLFDYSKRAHEDGQPRMASLALLQLDEDLSVASEKHFLVKPIGWEMTESATKINGLTQEMLMADGIPVGDVLGEYILALETSNVIVGYNVAYDLKVMRGELRRAEMEDHFLTTASLDCMRPLVDVCKIPKAKGSGYKLPKLVEAYRSIFGRDFEGAHGALADAKACAEIFKEMHPKGIFKVHQEQDTQAK